MEAMDIRMLIPIALLLGLFAVFAFGVWRTYRRMARSAGYDSIGTFLRAAPRSDREKRDSVDLTLRGAVLCLLGLGIPGFFPLLLIGLLPLFHGARKVAYSSMGLGLVDDAEPPYA